MKLAEALMYRADLQKKSEELENRILANLKVQEGEKPYEDPESLIFELMNLQEEFCSVVIQINRANNREKLESGITLSEALVKRDSLMKKRNLLANIASSVTEREFRLTHSEIKILITVDINKLQKQKDDLSKQIREIDTSIQSKNWTIEI